jgi:hypothetical protein
MQPAGGRSPRAEEVWGEDRTCSDAPETGAASMFCGLALALHRPLTCCEALLARSLAKTSLLRARVGSVLTTKPRPDGDSGASRQPLTMTSMSYILAIEMKAKHLRASTACVVSPSA